MRSGTAGLFVSGWFAIKGDMTWDRLPHYCHSWINKEHIIRSFDIPFVGMREQTFGML